MTKIAFETVNERPVQTRVENEFLDVVAKMAGTEDTLKFTLPNKTDADKKAVRIALQHLTQAGNAADVTVRRVTEDNGDGTASITFWAVEKIRKTPKTAKPVKK